MCECACMCMCVCGCEVGVVYEKEVLPCNFVLKMIMVDYSS